VMSTYTRKLSEGKVAYTQTEVPLYGSSRLGMKKPETVVKAIENGEIDNNTLETVYQRTLGAKQYELSNHLGNVMAVVSDVKTPIDTDGDNIADYYQAELVSATHYYPGGMQALSFNSGDYRYGFNGKEKDDEIKGEGNSYDFGARLLDPRIGRWLSLDPAAREYPSVSDYSYVANMPTIAIDPDGKRIFFVAGAGNDQVGWNYVERFSRIWSKSGITGFTRLNVSSSSDYMSKYVLPINDMLHAAQYRNDVAYRASGHLAIGEMQKPAHRRVREKVVANIKSTPLKEGEQLNLAGYSYGSVAVAQAAIQLADDGYVIDNLVLIGSPVSEDSDLYKTLVEYQKEGKIGQIIRHDIEGDKLSNPSGILEFIQGGKQNSGVDGPHFDLARPDNPETEEIDEGAEADKKIEKLGETLKEKGVK